MTATTMTKRKVQDGSEVSGSQRFRSLLVPVDLTPSSDRLLGRVARLPLADDARVTLLHVVPGSIPPSEQRRAERDATKALAEEVRHLRKLTHDKISVQPLVKVGSAAPEIAAAAAEVKAELIVVGRCGRRPLRDVFLGSTAERVIRQAKLPVLVVRLPPRSGYERPALALDLDDAASDVVRVMLRVLPPPRPQVEVIHAFSVPYYGLVYPSLSEDEAEERKDELGAHAAHELSQRLAKALAQAGVRPGDAPFWKTHVRYGSPRMVVQKVMKKAETDLLVLGTRGYSGAAYVFLGTVAGDLLRAVDCDVLVVPPGPRKK
jgi:nucleotide-binding universal stress UspA family protein